MNTNTTLDNQWSKRTSRIYCKTIIFCHVFLHFLLLPELIVSLVGYEVYYSLVCIASLFMNLDWLPNLNSWKVFKQFRWWTLCELDLLNWVLPMWCYWSKLCIIFRFKTPLKGAGHLSFEVLKFSFLPLYCIM